MKSIHPSSLLKTALLADATVSGGSALLHLLLPGPMTELLALPRMLIVESGLFLVGFVALLVLMIRGARIASALLGLVIVGNIGWAVGCIALWAGGAVAPSAWGLAYLALNAVAVLVFAGWEWAGLRASRPADPATVAVAH